MSSSPSNDFNGKGGPVDYSTAPFPSSIKVLPNAAGVYGFV